MNALQKLQIIIQSVGVMVFFVTLGINYLQLRKMTEQVAAMRLGADAQQILSQLDGPKAAKAGKAAKAVGRNTQNLRRDSRGPNTQVMYKHRTAEENNVG